MARRGTELYSAAPEPGFDPVAVFRDRAPVNVALRRAAIIPYRPNTILAMANTPLSFHGVQTLADLTTRRISLNSWLQFSRPSYDTLLGHLPGYAEAYGR